MSFYTSIVFLAGTTCLAIVPPVADETRLSDAPSFRGKLVLFGAQRVPQKSGTVEILLMNPDGSGVESHLKLDDDVARMTGRISPDGRRLAFGTISGDGKRSETWILEVDGTEVIRSRSSAVTSWTSSYMWSTPTRPTSSTSMCGTVR